MQLKTIHYEIVTETKFGNFNRTLSFFFNDLLQAKAEFYKRKKIYEHMSAEDKANCRISFYAHNLATGSTINWAVVGFGVLDSNLIQFYESFS